MASVDGSESPPASRTLSSPRVSPIERIRHARLVHEQLQGRRWRDTASIEPSENRSVDRGVRVMKRVDGDVAALAAELQRLLRLHGSSTDSSSAVALRVEKIGSHEKDMFVMHLLKEVAFLQSQRDDVVAVGEKLTTKLVQQQHEMRTQFKAQSARLQEQLHQAQHHHPEIARLEEKIAQLEQINAQCEQKLLFAAQKLHRSRQRERALRKEQESDPLLWDL